MVSRNLLRWAIVTVPLVIGVLFAGAMLPGSALAGHGSAACTEAANQPPGWGGKVYNCSFPNNTGVAVNDIEIRFIDRAQKVGPPTDPLWACTGAGGAPPPRAASTTIVCRDASGSRPVPAGGSFKITVRADVVPPLDWTWTLNRTVVPTTTHTPTNTPMPSASTDTPMPTSTPTDTDQIPTEMVTLTLSSTQPHGDLSATVSASTDTPTPTNTPVD